MKRTNVVLLMVVALFFVACEGNITQPNQLDQATWERSLAKDARVVAKLDSIVPEGTVYILPDDTTEVLTAKGGEDLPAGSTVENLKGSLYKVHLYSEMKVGFDGLSTVTVDYPTNLLYLNAQEKWISLDSSGTVSAKAVKTGKLGEGILSVSAESSYDEDDTQGGNS
jgi:hypothetical protein